jgi:YD repeat-containing protein
MNETLTTDKERLGFRGPVKTAQVQTARFEEQNGGVTEQPWFSHSITFDQEGRLIDQVNRNPDGSCWRTVNVYSNSGELLTTRAYDSSGTLINESRYVYDDEGRLTAEQHITEGGKVTTPTTYRYDDEGKRIKIEEYDVAEESEVMIGIEGTNTSISAGDARRVETLYDGRGAVVQVTAFNAEGLLLTRVEIRRDTMGNSIEEVQYVGDVIPFGPCTSDSCSTVEMGLVTEEQKAGFAAEIARLFSPGTAMSTHTHRYDAAGRLVESELTMMGMKANRQTFTYDDAGNKLEETNYDDEGKLASKAIFTREYDSQDNWTKEVVSTASNWDVEFGLSTPVQVTYRVITYW